MKYQKADDSAAKNVEIEEVMNTWTLQMGYPVVTVTKSGNQISATQQRFLYHSQGNFTEEFSSPYRFVSLFIRDSRGSGRWGFRGPDPVASNRTTNEIHANPSFFGWMKGSRDRGALALKTWRHP